MHNTHEQPAGFAAFTTNLSPPWSGSVEELRTPQEQRAYRSLRTRAWILWIVFSPIAVPALLLHMLLSPLGDRIARARLQYDAILVDQASWPALFGVVVAGAQRLGMAGVPVVYVADLGGMLNAFALRLLKRDFVLLSREAVDTFLAGGASDAISAELQFVVGHELGHLALGHVKRDRFLSPARLSARLYAAYRRGCELSADRCGCVVNSDVPASQRALVALSGGEKLAAAVQIAGVARQHERDHNFVLDMMRSVHTYPRMSERIRAIQVYAKGDIQPEAQPSLWARVWSHVMPGLQTHTIAARMGLIYLVIVGVAMVPQLLAKTGTAPAPAAPATATAPPATADAAPAADENAPLPPHKKVLKLSLKSYDDYALQINEGRFELTTLTQGKTQKRVLDFAVDPQAQYLVDEDGDLAIVTP